MTTPVAQKIMIIRHAEKPDDSGIPAGVDINGEQDAEALIVRGWQRAGALVVLFDPARGDLQTPRLARPNRLFATAVAKHSKSERPQETVTPLSQRLDISIDQQYDKGQAADVAAAALASPGAVLICWQHEDIPEIGNVIMGNTSTVPQQWPENRFDLVWVFDLDRASGRYQFSQVPQLLLSGDQDNIIPPGIVKPGH